MYTGSLPDIDNNVTWNLTGEVVDPSTNKPIDLTDAVVTMTITDDNGCTVLTGSSDDGTIIFPQFGTIQFNFSDTALNRLSGTYNVDIRFARNGEKRKIFRGTVNIIEGADR